MPLVGSSGLVDLGTSSGGSFERYNREGMADVVPSHVLIRGLLTFRLQSFHVALGEGSLEQLHRLCVAPDLSLDVGKVKGLDISSFTISFDNIYQIVDVWRENSITGAVATFNLKKKKKKRKTEAENELDKITNEEVEQLDIVAKLENAINNKKVEIVQVPE